MKSEKKKCICCNKELPFNGMYFPVDNNKKSGLRTKCRVCSNSKYLTELEFKKLNKIKSWSKEEEDILIKYYKEYTNEELIQLFLPDRTYKSIEGKASRLNLGRKSEDAILRSIENMSNKKKEYYKTHDGNNKGKVFSNEARQKMSIAKKSINKWKNTDNPRSKNPLFGKENGRWKGGITDLYRSLRNEIGQWQRESMEYCNYHCVITNQNGNFDVHHVVPFKYLIYLTFYNLKLDIREQTSDYSDKEFMSISNELRRLHNKYGYGACVNKNIHKLYHDTYGYTNNTIDNFLEFIQRIESGEFNEWFNNENLKIEINYEYIKYLNDIKEKHKEELVS